MIINKKIVTPSGSRTYKQLYHVIDGNIVKVCAKAEIDLQKQINSYADSVSIERVYAAHLLGDDTFLNANKSLDVPVGVTLDPSTDVDSTLKKLYESYQYKDDMSFKDFAAAVTSGNFASLNIKKEEVQKDGE